MIKLTRFMLIFFIVLFVVISAVTVLAAIILFKYSSSRIDDAVTKALSVGGKTEFYSPDRNSMTAAYDFKKIEGVFLSSAVRYEYVLYDQIPKHLIKAFISIEDKRFFEHTGIDYKRTAAAATGYMLSGSSTFGGSTITQQLIKNLTGNNEKKIERKLSEAFSAMELEERFDKTEILEMYLNIINLAHGCQGVGAASQYYFSKQVSELSLCESAAIAAITNNPSRYDPQDHPEENRKRREIVLKCMLDQGNISQSEYENALKCELKLNISSQETNSINTWYIDTVIEDVISDYSEKYGVSKQNASILLYNGGYKIYTAMDEQIQSIVSDYFENTNNFPRDSSGSSPFSSIIIIDRSSGDILAIAGNIGEKKANRIQNYSTITKRPPGSAIKPLSVYAPAIDRKIVNWSSIIEDYPVNKSKNGKPWPSNSNNKYLGPVTLKYAIANSLNTVAVKLLHELGNKQSFDFLTECLDLDSLDSSLDIGDASLALGQPTVGVTLRELTTAYTIFQNGIMLGSRTYYKVTDSSGRIILDNPSIQKIAISGETASIMTKLLQTVVSEGTAQGYIDLGDIETAGKTGTTQLNCDKYFIGYTPDLLAGVWQGYEYPRSIDCFNGNYSICIWNDIMNLIYDRMGESRKYEKKFKVTKNVKQYSYDKNGVLYPADISEENDYEIGWFDTKRKNLP